MSSFLIKNNLSFVNTEKCPNILLFGILNSENVFDSYLWEKHEKFGKFWLRAEQNTACGCEDLFFALHLILGGKLDICGRDDLFFLFQSVQPPASKNLSSFGAVKTLFFLLFTNIFTKTGHLQMCRSFFCSSPIDVTEVNLSNRV